MGKPLKLHGNEHEEQAAVIQWKNLNLKKYPGLKNLYAIANGGYRNIQTAVKLKEEGVVAGVLDLFLACPRGAYAGLYIEMKVKPNKPTPEQLEFMDNVRQEGYSAVVCYSATEAINVITDYLRGKKWSEYQKELLEYIAQKHHANGGI